jgi:hypothetical protein
MFLVLKNRNMDKKILNSVNSVLKDKKIIRVSDTLDGFIEQSVLDIPQEVWYKYPSMAEDYMKMELEKRGVKCIRPFPNSHRDRKYFYDQLIWKVRSDGYVEGMDSEPIFICYKNSTNLAEACFEYGYKTIMPDYKLFKDIQLKVNLENFGVSTGNGLIPFFEEKLSNLEYTDIKKRLGGKVVIQFSFSETGWNTSGSLDTFIIKTAEDFINAKKLITRDAPAKISQFISGYPISMNCVNTEKGTVTSDPYLQVLGEKHLTSSNIILTGANFDESYSFVPARVLKKSHEIAKNIGEALLKRNYKGHFGIDFIVDEEKNDAYVMEINPRFTGSSCMHTLLASREQKTPLLLLHIAEYLECLPESFDVTKYEESMHGIWKGGYFFMMNREGAVKQIDKAPTPGVYKIKNGKVEFVREYFSLDDIPEKDHFLVNKIYPLNRNIEPERPDISLCRIFSLEKMFNGFTELNDKYLEVYQQVYKMFEFNDQDTYDSSVPYEAM